ncbi:helix-turn-helix domain-containing protein [Sinorhizobium meliloti]|uniref:helix-turn-helix domain-containing protein n=1 Tax=Rhizobium meliloti TaxID=382 RepID=UPI0029B9D689|nr:helix-turn-helix domain-containing protein [Sinorhizobium meliloti]MDW9997804.1 helix-turn-helix domain-containing protein [Sinorhizobium meliloti]
MGFRRVLRQEGNRSRKWDRCPLTTAQLQTRPSGSPHEFVASRRLEEARRKPFAAPPGSTVIRIAMDIGFFELGRFAARYREHFGETPSATLARGDANQLSH